MDRFGATGSADGEREDSIPLEERVKTEPAVDGGGHNASARRRLQAGTQDKKALIVISDGGDYANTHTLAEVLKMAEQSSAGCVLHRNLRCG